MQTPNPKEEYWLANPRQEDAEMLDGTLKGDVGRQTPPLV